MKEKFLLSTVLISIFCSLTYALDKNLVSDKNAYCEKAAKLAYEAMIVYQSMGPNSDSDLLYRTIHTHAYAVELSLDIRMDIYHGLYLHVYYDDDLMRQHVAEDYSRKVYLKCLGDP